MRLLMVIGLSLAALAFMQPLHAREPIVTNHLGISVIDGDTIQIGNTVYQLAGIDAPELGQVCDHGGHLWLCGLEAAYKLRKQLEIVATPIRCFVQHREKALPIAACMLGDQELSVIMLKSGNVVAHENGAPHYAAAEHSAKQGSLGIWGSTFIAPKAWRAGKRLANEHRFDGSSHPILDLPWKGVERTFLHLNSEHAACMVKGVIDADGNHLYYGPLDAAYPAIEISPAKGEKYFCGDDNARQAGWKRPGEN